MVELHIPKKKFLSDWAAEFIIQILISFDLKIKNLKNIEFKSSNERKLYFNTTSTYQDIYFLYFMDFIKQIVDAQQGGRMPTMISEYPLYIDYAIQNSLTRISNHPSFENVEKMCYWVKKIMIVNEKFLHSAKSSEIQILKYSEILEHYLNKEAVKKKIDLFFLDYSNSNELLLQALHGIGGIDGAIAMANSSDIQLKFKTEKNIFIDINSRIMFPLMVSNSKKLNNVTPSRIGAVVSYAKSMVSSAKLETVKLNNAQVIASVYQESPRTSKKNALKEIFFKEMNMLSSHDIATLHETKDIDAKANKLAVALLLSDYKRHFEEIKNSIEEALALYLDTVTNEDGFSIEPEFLYDISKIIKEEFGDILLYSDIKEYEEEIKKYLEIEISKIINNTLRRIR